MDDQKVDQSGNRGGESDLTAAHSTHGIPGEANPALAETVAFEEGRIHTADLLLARETAEAQLFKEPHDRDMDSAEGAHFRHSQGPLASQRDAEEEISEVDPFIVGRPRFQTPSLFREAGLDAEEAIYDREEAQGYNVEPEVRTFAPLMSNIPSDKENRE